MRVRLVRVSAGLALLALLSGCSVPAMGQASSDARLTPAGGGPVDTGDLLARVGSATRDTDGVSEDLFVGQGAARRRIRINVGRGRYHLTPGLEFDQESIARFRTEKRVVVYGQKAYAQGPDTEAWVPRENRVTGPGDPMRFRDFAWDPSPAFDPKNFTGLQAVYIGPQREPHEGHTIHEFRFVPAGQEGDAASSHGRRLVLDSSMRLFYAEDLTAAGETVNVSVHGYGNNTPQEPAVLTP